MVAMLIRNVHVNDMLSLEMSYLSYKFNENNELSAP